MKKRREYAAELFPSLDIDGVSARGQNGLRQRFEFVVDKSAIPRLKARTKQDAVREMVGSLAGAKALPESCQDSIVEAVLTRQRLASTGMGGGVAVPHARHASVQRVVATIAWSENGIDFDGPDGEPVHLIFLIVSPPDQPRQHLRALAEISLFLTKQGRKPHQQHWPHDLE